MGERIYKLMRVWRQKNDWVDGIQLSRLCIVFWLYDFISQALLLFCCLVF